MVLIILKHLGTIIYTSDCILSSKGAVLDNTSYIFFQLVLNIVAQKIVVQVVK